KAAAVRGFSSTFTLPKRMSRRSAASCSMTGAIIRHGPHQGAQKSTTLAPVAIAFPKLVSVRVTGCASSWSNGVLHFPQRADWPLPTAGTRFACPHAGHRTMSLIAEDLLRLGRHDRGPRAAVRGTVVVMIRRSSTLGFPRI